jgi:hypothetical protein
MHVIAFRRYLTIIIQFNSYLNEYVNSLQCLMIFRQIDFMIIHAKFGQRSLECLCCLLIIGILKCHSNAAIVPNGLKYAGPMDQILNIADWKLKKDPSMKYRHFSNAQILCALTQNKWNCIHKIGFSYNTWNDLRTKSLYL